MTQNTQGTGLEPLGTTDGHLPMRPQSISPGIRVSVRGRSIRLRGLRRAPTGLFRWLAILGPGLIASNAGNDAGAIATYSSAGAQFGYDLLWLMLLITISLAVVQEMSGRLGAATGRGLLDLIRERFGLGWSVFAVILVLIANIGLIVSEFVGVGASMELFGISHYVAIPIAALLVWSLIVFGNYRWVEKIFVAMTVVFFAYPVATILSHPHWGDVAKGTLIPHLQWNKDYILLFVGLAGASITPYQQIFQQSAVVEKGVARRHYGPERIDTYIGAILSNLVAGFIIIATAATLFASGHHDIQSASDAAEALRPVAGDWAFALFALGLLGASLLSVAVLPLATAYSINETFGLPKGLNLSFRRARAFFGLFTGLMVLGLAIALIPDVPVFKLLVGIQVLNGVLLPVQLLFMLLLVNERRLMRELKNSLTFNILGWGTFAVVSFSVVVLLVTQALGLFGVELFR
ncbi:MAG: Nramp family divalent metal transporter [Herpetosiphon sp.]